jgi:hypothetical protein
LRHAEFVLPDPIFGGEVKKVEFDDDETSLELDDRVEIDHKMGL